MTLTIEERLESLEYLVAKLIRGDYQEPPTLEDQHQATVAKVKQAKERGGLSA